MSCEKYATLFHMQCSNAIVPLLAWNSRLALKWPWILKHSKNLELFLKIRSRPWKVWNLTGINQTSDGSNPPPKWPIWVEWGVKLYSLTHPDGSKLKVGANHWNVYCW